MHLDPEQLERTLHGELRPDDGLVREHLAECQECRLRVNEAELDEAWIIASRRCRSASARGRLVGRVGPGRSGWRRAWR